MSAGRVIEVARAEYLRRYTQEHDPVQREEEDT